MRGSSLSSVAAGLLALLVFAASVRAAEEVDLQLVLMVDASGSVDDGEYRLQRQGYVQAFRDPSVINAIRSGYRGRIAISYIEWTGPLLHAPVVDWVTLSDEASVAAFVQRLERVPRLLFGGGTSLGHAVLHGADAIAASGYVSQRKVIDVSGDGSNRSGIPPSVARERVVAQGFTVNGLPILTDEPGLDEYYRNFVIGGPGAFMIPAADFADFAKAIRAKLIREIAGIEGSDERDGLETAARP